MIHTAPTPTLTGRTTTIVYINTFADAKRMRTTKGWRTTGGIILACDFEPSHEQRYAMVRDAMKTARFPRWQARWCEVVSE